MNKIYQKITVFVSLCLITSLGYSQCMMIPIPLDERVNNSSIVFEGKVLSKSTSWDELHRKIETHNTVEIYRTFKGDLTTSTIDVVTEGGVVGNDMLIVSTSLDLEVGQVGVFTLIKENNGVDMIPYASTQGFVKYDRVTGNAKGVFDSYDSPNQLYSSIRRITGERSEININYLDELNQNSLNRIALPVISGFSPSSAPAGTYTLLTITGSNFGTIPGDVEFGDADDGGASYITATPTLIQSWSNTQITIYVPEGATTGTIRVTNSTAETGTSASSLVVPYNISGVNSDFVTGDFRDYTADLVNNNGSGGYTFTFNADYFTNTDAVDRYDEVIEQWRCETGINWGSNGATTTTIDSEGSDGVNVVMFDDNSALASGVLGTCYSFYSACSSGGTPYWRVNELDVKFDSGTNWNFTSSAPSFTQYDFYSVMLHEMGHGHQLGHVPVVSDVMYYSISNGTEKRTLNSNNSTAGNYVMTRSNANETLYTGSTGGSIVTNLCGTSEIIANNCNVAPTAEFSANNTGTCNSSLTVIFTDESVGSPTSWSWDFGDGSSSTSQNPTHTYSTSGTFNVELIAFNANGSNTITKNEYISIGGGAPSTPCVVTTTDLGNQFGMGILNFTFGSINNSTNDAVDDGGYLDFSCTNMTFVDVSSSNNVSITTGTVNNEDVRIYIDFDDDGVFSQSGDLVFSSDGILGTHSGSINIPALPSVTGKVLTMRVVSDFSGNNIASGCDDVEYGQHEDYGIYINSIPCTPPSITLNPNDSTIVENSNTSFSVTANDAISYQWQENTGSGFNDISNGGFYSGATSPTLNLISTPVSYDGYTYRCVVTGDCLPNATSNLATLTVTPISGVGVCYLVTCNDGTYGLQDMSTNPVTKTSVSFIPLNTGATQYTVQISTVPDFSSDVDTKIGNSVAASNYHWSFLTPDTTYYTRVSVDGGAYGDVRSFQTHNVGYSFGLYVYDSQNATQYLSNSPTTTSSIQITPKNVDGASQYTVEIDDDIDFNSPMTKIGSDVSKYNYGFSGLSTSTVYYVRVKTDLNNIYGTVYQFTTNSTVVIGGSGPSYVQYTKDVVNGVQSTNLTPTIYSTVYLIPKKVTGAGNYNVEVSLQSDFSSGILSKSGSTVKSNNYDFNLNCGEMYYSRVQIDGGFYGETKTINVADMGASFAHYIYDTINGSQYGKNSPTTYTDIKILPSDVGSSTYSVQISDVADFSSGVMTKLSTTTLRDSFEFTGLTDNTIYYVRVQTDEGCGYGRVYQFTTTSLQARQSIATIPNSVDNENMSSAYQAYPNPFTHDFYVRVDSDVDEKLSINISDLTGRIVYELTNKETNQNIKLGSNLRNGIYLMELTHGNNTKLMKVIKK